MSAGGRLARPAHGGCRGVADLHLHSQEHRAGARLPGQPDRGPPRCEGAAMGGERRLPGDGPGGGAEPHQVLAQQRPGRLRRILDDNRPDRLGITDKAVLAVFRTWRERRGGPDLLDRMVSQQPAAVSAPVEAANDPGVEAEGMLAGTGASTADAPRPGITVAAPGSSNVLWDGPPTGGRRGDYAAEGTAYAVKPSRAGEVDEGAEGPGGPEWFALPQWENGAHQRRGVLERGRSAPRRRRSKAPHWLRCWGGFALPVGRRFTGGLLTM